MRHCLEQEKVSLSCTDVDARLSVTNSTEPSVVAPQYCFRASERLIQVERRGFFLEVLCIYLKPNCASKSEYDRAHVTTECDSAYQKIPLSSSLKKFAAVFDYPYVLME